MASDLERAKDADLVTLPPAVTGTNCANCRFVSGNHCDHPKVDQDLDDGAKRMCCKYWDAPGTKRAWEDGDTIARDARRARSLRK